MVTLDFTALGPVRNRLEEADQKIERQASTLRDAIAAACDHLGMEIVPFPGDRYFAAWYREKPAPKPLHPVLDIHVIREHVELCPRHDLDFPLLDGDVVLFAILIC